jgi:hypothetical protein
MRRIEGPGGMADASVTLQAQVEPGNRLRQRASVHAPEQNPDETCDHIELVMRKEQGLKRTSSRHGKVGFGAAWNERRVAGRQYVTQMLG